MSVHATSAHLSPADEALTPTQRHDLRTLARMMISAELEHKIPGADDAAVQADILATMERDTPTARACVD